MKCDCCGRKKKLFESFVKIDAGNLEIYLCSKCNDFAYKVRDTVNEGNTAEAEALLEEWNSRVVKATPAFKKWQSDYLSGLSLAEENDPGSV